jgi:hypothetical protein
MRMQSAVRYGANAECGAVVPLGTNSDLASLLPSHRSHRFLLHNVKQRSLLRSRGALLSAGSCFRFVRIFRPQPRGGGAPETGHWHFRRACEARRLTSRATGGRLSALQRGDFRRRDRRFVFRQCPPESALRLRPRPDARKRPADRVPYLPSRGSLRSPGRHSPAPPSGHLRRRPS